jgi:hypothetical protein
MKRFIYFSLLVAVAATAALSRAQQPASERKSLSKQNWAGKLQDGDMVFIRSVTEQANTIAALVQPPPGTDPDKVFTHCGIVFNDKGVWKVYEGRGRDGTGPVTLEQWQKDEGGGTAIHNVYVRRLMDRSVLTEDALKRMRERADALHHTHYDWGFSWSDEYVYCSELISKAYENAGAAANALNKPHPIKDYYETGHAKAKTIKDHLNSTKAKMCRVGKPCNPEEPAISPEEIYNSSGLVSVNDDSPNAPSSTPAG